MTSAICAVVLVLTTAQSQTDQRIAVHVRVQPVAHNGFVEPVNRDLAQIADRIKKDLHGSRSLRIVEAPESADVVLSVTAHHVEVQEVGAAAMPIGNMAVALPITSSSHIVSVDLSAGEYAKSLTGEGSSTKKSADVIAKDAIAWIGANETTLRSRRGSR